MAGCLYLVATPIGNLEDMTFRAVRVLKGADLIACEDTRTSRPLLDAYDVRTPVTSYHKFNEREKSEELAADMLRGKSVALITDAGMPGISDPGEILARKCLENGIRVIPIPGASASVTALAASGLDSSQFVFEGFLPREPKEKKDTLTVLKNETRTMIFYEAPHRLKKTLASFVETFGEERKVTVCRELTKKYEEIRPSTLGEELARKSEPRGEYVLVIAGKAPEELAAEKAASFRDIPISEHVAIYEEQGLDRKAAMKAAALDRGISRRDVYQALLEDN